jgi:hypothetical protein
MPTGNEMEKLKVNHVIPSKYDSPEEPIGPDIILNIPKRIYLQVGEDWSGGERIQFSSISGEVSWCTDRIDDSDIEYVLAPGSTPQLPEAGEREVSDAEIDKLLAKWDYSNTYSVEGAHTDIREWMRKQMKGGK